MNTKIQQLKNKNILGLWHRWEKQMFFNNLPARAPSARRSPSELWRGASSGSPCTLDCREAGTWWRKRTVGGRGGGGGHGSRIWLVEIQYSAKTLQCRRSPQVAFKSVDIFVAIAKKKHVRLDISRNSSLASPDRKLPQAINTLRKTRCHNEPE